MTTSTTPADRVDRAPDRGATLAEYALLVGLIAAMCIGALRYLGGSTDAALAASAPPAAAGGGGGGGSSGSGGGGSSSGGGGGGGSEGDTDSAAEEAMQDAKADEAVAAQRAKDEAAAQLAASVSVAGDDVGEIYWRAKNGKSVKWETTATVANDWDGAVVLDVQITRVFGDGHTKQSRTSVDLAPGASADVDVSNNLMNTNKSVKDDVVMVTVEVGEVRAEHDTGEPLVVVPDQSLAVVDAPPFE